MFFFYFNAMVLFCLLHVQCIHKKQVIEICLKMIIQVDVEAHIPISQLEPDQPPGHSQLNDPSLFTHLPWLQGELAQSSISENQQRQPLMMN